MPEGLFTWTALLLIPAIHHGSLDMITNDNPMTRSLLPIARLMALIAGYMLLGLTLLLSLIHI